MLSTARPGPGSRYLRDLAAGSTTLVSATADASDSSNADAGGPVLFQPTGTGLGGVLFATRANNLGPTDTNIAFDLYLAQLRQ